MPLVEFEKDDFLRNKVVDVSWYLIKIGEFSEESTADGEGTKYVFRDCKIVKDDDSGDEKWAGVPVKIELPTKKEGRGFILGFYAALQGYSSVDELQAAGKTRMRIEEAAGQMIVAFVENNTWQGRTTNKINHKYRPVKAA